MKTILYAVAATAIFWVIYVLGSTNAPVVQNTQVVELKDGARQSGRDSR